MNDRQEHLYLTLLHNGDYLTQSHIANKLCGGYGDNTIDYHNSQGRKLLTDDIRAINNDPTVEKIIISTPKGIKLATKDEAIKYLKGQYAALFRKLKRLRLMEKKVNLNGQFKIFTDENGDFVSSFVEE